jgi:hypothetical protein
MMNRLRLFALVLGSCLSLWLWPSLVWADSKQTPPASAPQELTPWASDLSWRGKSRFRYLGFEVYDATLWTAPDFKAHAAHEHPLALELHYLRDIDAQDIAQSSLKEMRRLRKLTAAQEKEWMAQMLRVFPPIRKGDRLLGLQRPGEAAVFWHNGQPRGEVADAEFANLFFGIWLSPRTSAPGFRQALVGDTR